MKKTLFISSVCLAIAGWGLKLPPMAVNAETPSVVKQSNSITLAPAVQPQVELLDPGTEPRQELRFKPVVNTKQTATMTLKMNAVTSVAGKSAPQFKSPATVVTMQTLVTKVDPNGDIHYNFSYSNADVVADPTTPAKVVNTMRSRIKQIVGTSGSITVDNRGQTKAATFVFPQTLNTNMKQTMEQMSKSLEQVSAPLPVQAVGVGAKWHVSSALKLGGINLTQVATYQLVSLRDRVANLNMSLEQHADPQKLTQPGLPAGITLALKSYAGQGQGQMTTGLNQVMPIHSTLSMQSNTEVNAKPTGSAQEMTVGTKLFMNLAFQSR